ncbi:hypothetical protein PIB30_010292 [Stylosanthes scabra]|uniref:Transmembrane protein n=1 Tax=Stylosanthes scabra TaxID=79078 RepID=A0ABU6U4R3_9FABA|nr:hypothetical protein [Stylosanthes scabra]
MEVEGGGAFRRGSRVSSYEKLAAIGLVVLAVASPLYIDSKPESELVEDEPINFAFWFPVLLFLLMVAIALSTLLDQSFTRFDRNWIHRVGGSSGGIILILTLLFLVLKFKSSV